MALKPALIIFASLSLVVSTELPRIDTPASAAGEQDASRRTRDIKEPQFSLGLGMPPYLTDAAAILESSKFFKEKCEEFIDETIEEQAITLENLQLDANRFPIFPSVRGGGGNGFRDLIMAKYKARGAGVVLEPAAAPFSADCSPDETGWNVDRTYALYLVCGHEHEKEGKSTPHRVPLTITPVVEKLGIPDEETRRILGSIPIVAHVRIHRPMDSISVKGFVEAAGEKTKPADEKKEAAGKKRGQ